MWDKDGQRNCAEIEHSLKQKVNVYTKEMLDWMKGYFASEEVNLTKEIETIIHQTKTTAKTKQKEEKKPILYTLNYLCKDISVRVKRIGFVRRKWEEWNWLETNTDVTDFEYLFEDKPRDCQLIWKASNAVLAMLLAKLLNRKDIFGHIKGCSPRSVVINQFKKSYDKHEDRVDELNLTRIEWTLKLLDYKVALELPQLPFHQGDDISDKALQEVFAGNMHITKDLNKYNE